MPHASFCMEFLSLAPSYFMCRVFVTGPAGFLLAPSYFMCRVFVTCPAGFLLAPSYFMCRVFVTCPAGFLLAPSYFMCRVFVACPMLFYVQGFCYTPHAIFSGEFLLHAPHYFIGVFLLCVQCYFL